MKKIIIIILILFCVELSAQTDKGFYILEGGMNTDFTISKLLGFNVADSDNIDSYVINNDVYGKATSKLSISFLGGYFLTDIILFGVEGAYESSAVSERLYNITTKTSTEMYMVYPVVRAYFGEHLWCQAKYGFGSVKNNSQINDGLYITDLSDDSPLTDFSLSLGYALYLNNMVSLNPSIAYEVKTKTTKSIDEYGYFYDISDVYNGLAFTFTLAVHLDNMYYH